MFRARQESFTSPADKRFGITQFHLEAIFSHKCKDDTFILQKPASAEQSSWVASNGIIIGRIFNVQIFGVCYEWSHCQSLLGIIQVSLAFIFMPPLILLEDSSFISYLFCFDQRISRTMLRRLKVSIVRTLIT